jgi:hypothetical protein
VIKLALDENFDARIVKGLRRRLAGLDSVSVQESGLTSAPDPDVLAWAAAEERVLLSHDLATMPPLAWARVGRGQPMAGLVMVPNLLAVGRAIKDLDLLVQISSKADLENRVVFLPL